MQVTNADLVNAVFAALTFPLYLQGPFLAISWGAGDSLWLLAARRLFLLLPVLAFLFACWVTIASFLTLIFRQRRREFTAALFITWWDLGKAVVAFWGGIFHFALHFVLTAFEMLKVLIIGVWTLLQELLFIPFRLLGRLGRGLATSSTPWLAVALTLLWCVIETFIFTYVTTPLVIDTFANLTGEAFPEVIIRIPLFTFLFFVILGSYAVLATFIDAIRSKDIGAILGIGVIEIIVLSVEVLFLYREFVDALVPWLAQYSENFELGVWGTLGLSAFAWFGIRSISWFLFAAHGTPTILAIIKGQGVALRQPPAGGGAPAPRVTAHVIEQVTQDMAWFQQRGEELLASFMLPPLQIIGVAINFCTLLINSRHLFDLPFKTLQDILPSSVLLRRFIEADRAAAALQAPQPKPGPGATMGLPRAEMYHE